MTARASAILMSLLVLLLLVPGVALANDGGPRVHVFQNITVGADDHIEEAVCIFCSIRIAGTSGDAVAILGNIVVDGTINGDAVSVGGGIRLGEDAEVSGDTVAIGQGVYRHPNAVAKGEVVSQSGPVILLGLIIVPLLPFILVIWLVVMLVRRGRSTPATQPAYRR